MFYSTHFLLSQILLFDVKFFASASTDLIGLSKSKIFLYCSFTVGSDFVLEARYTMQLDFRTSSKTGVLLSASSRLGYGFTLELHNGKVVGSAI